MRFLRVFSIKSVPEDRMIRLSGQCVLLHREPPQKLATVNSNHPAARRPHRSLIADHCTRAKIAAASAFVC